MLAQDSEVNFVFLNLGTNAEALSRGLISIPQRCYTGA